MPALSCRDWDDTCDWFWRDNDVGRLIVSDMVHGEEQHERFVKIAIDDAIAGKKPISDFVQSYVDFMRWD